VSFEEKLDETDRKPVSRSRKVNRVEGYPFSSLTHLLDEGPLIECHILGDKAENPEEELVKRAKSSLRPIVENCDHPRLPLQIRDSDDLSDNPRLTTKVARPGKAQKVTPPKQSVDDFSKLWTTNHGDTLDQSPR